MKRTTNGRTERQAIKGTDEPTYGLMKSFVKAEIKDKTNKAQQTGEKNIDLALEI